MNSQPFEWAKEQFAALGVDVEAALDALDATPISLHCWQGDDVLGFEGGGALTGGIQATGHYPGRARNIQELRDDMSFVLSLVPGPSKVNLHANYLDSPSPFPATRWSRGILHPGRTGRWKRASVWILTARSSRIRSVKTVR